MKVTREEEHLLGNIKTSVSKIVYVYFCLGLSGLGFAVIQKTSPLTTVVILFFSGILFGISIEKFYNIKIYKLCLKLYQDFKLR